ncbi:hypothetical protein VTN31DRAFT_3026 [Thermomyces dupontii]|uniref:uncharacterized protein n=1 Tax=Talaromyces thermophilus TaxID=28565 RepID=UPI0037438A28
MSSKARRVQHRSCDQCRKGKRGCDANVGKALLIRRNALCQTTPNELSPWDSCSNCKKWRRACTFNWLLSLHMKNMTKGGHSNKTRINKSRPDPGNNDKDAMRGRERRFCNGNDVESRSPPRDADDLSSAGSDQSVPMTYGAVNGSLGILHDDMDDWLYGTTSFDHFATDECYPRHGQSTTEESLPGLEDSWSTSCRPERSTSYFVAFSHLLSADASTLSSPNQTNATGPQSSEKAPPDDRNQQAFTNNDFDAVAASIDLALSCWLNGQDVPDHL